MDKAQAIVLRTTDWSESSRIATLWTRELGKVRALAKGGRRLRSAFDNALDLLTVCGIVLIRKSSGSLDLLTEAQVVTRFPRLREDLSALYAGYYVAELLADWTQELDPHPALYEEAIATLGDLGQPGADNALRVMRFEMVFLDELGYRPALDRCAGCQGGLQATRLAFCALSGGVLCPGCQKVQREHRPLSADARTLLLALGELRADWRRPWPSSVRAEVRQHLGTYLTALRGRPPRLLPYLGS
jgi:DNA repair protein RecO (recombination protein O)